MRSRASSGCAAPVCASGPAGNTPAATEALLRKHVDFVGSSGRWGIEKPSAAFFERVAAEAGAEPEELAYVGDRVRQ